MTDTALKFETSYVLSEISKAALMQLPGVSWLRKRIYSRELDATEQVFEHYKAQWRVYRAALDAAGVDLRAARVVELGPGPLLVNGIHFIAAGAASYSALDRYPVLRTDTTIRQTYRKLIRSLSPAEQEACAGLVLDADTGPVFDDRIHNVVVFAEEAAKTVPAGAFDIAVSFNFMEHVIDLPRVIGGIGHLLRVGGVMVHRVDVATHAARQRFHPLSQLTVSELTWKMMGAKVRALPNRVRPSEYLAAAERAGFRTTSYEITNQLAAERVRAIRPYLALRFRNCPAADLSTLDFVWVARSPEGGG